MVLNQIAFFADMPNLQTVELALGIIAGIFVLSSLTFKCTTTKMNILMRCLNTAGCAFFVTEGVLMVVEGNYAGWSLVVPNAILIGFNAYYIVKMLIGLKKGSAAAKDSTAPSSHSENVNAVTAETADKDTRTEAILNTVKQLADKCETMEELRAALKDVTP
ncbi:MAG: hypothetical protein NC132_06430 [Corallococcus sp.]|nr:hypothetical protein [Corallococcus sp.]MCM1359754.1 hypothetical protein [Corallococcus sp.]MCM1395720.1 hypothetical protein [Corallococcus sp.]